VDALQIIEAVPDDTSPRWIQTDRDAIYEGLQFAFPAHADSTPREPAAIGFLIADRPAP
jgi:hypothetical protein